MEVEKVTHSEDKKDTWITIRCSCKDFLVFHIYGSNIEWSKSDKNLNVKIHD